MEEEFKIIDSSKLQLASLKAFMEKLGYSWFNIDRAFYSPLYTNRSRTWISFNTATRLHNLSYIDWHGKLFREPFDNFPEEWIADARRAKLVKIVKMQNSKKLGIVVQSHMVDLIDKTNYDLFFNK